MGETSSSTVSSILNGTWRKRRISEDTANRILQLAKQYEYRVNRQASGLRKSRSGLIGMIIPSHEDRYIGTMAQVFDRMARSRQLQPIVVSTLRDGSLEVAAARTLISYQIDYLIVCGASNPDAVSNVCKQYNVPHANVDLPGKNAPSIITDNYWGAVQLTNIMIDRSQTQPTEARDRFYFIGGVAGDYNTDQRIAGFRDVLQQRLGGVSSSQILTCGFDPTANESAISNLCSSIGGLPRGIFNHSTLTFEGALLYLKTLHENDLHRCVFCSFDWNPLASYLRFPIHMAQQDAEGMLSEAFKIIDGENPNPSMLQVVKPTILIGE